MLSLRSVVVVSAASSLTAGSGVPTLREANLVGNEAFRAANLAVTRGIAMSRAAILALILEISALIIAILAVALEIEATVMIIAASTAFMVARIGCGAVRPPVGSRAGLRVGRLTVERMVAAGRSMYYCSRCGGVRFGVKTIELGSNTKNFSIRSWGQRIHDFSRVLPLSLPQERG